jgi:hypothetical protein
MFWKIDMYEDFNLYTFWFVYCFNTLHGSKGNVKSLLLSCLAIRCRDAPPNKLLLMPPIEEIETAFDNLVCIAFHTEKQGSCFETPTMKSFI